MSGEGSELLAADQQNQQQTSQAQVNSYSAKVWVHLIVFID